MEKLLNRNAILIVAGWVLVLLLLLDIRSTAHQNAKGIQTSRDVAAALAAHNEKVMLDFMSRTVSRWDELQRANPDVKVPKVIEPLTTPHLSEKEMERQPQ